ncbi:MAG: ParB N-terminal domain-containing protein [Planctomycetes bacterium]|nr:ParB N-terminal domain-containing protein [Planctomycetota bacterium]
MKRTLDDLTPQDIDVDTLVLDAKNPRLVEADFSETASQDDILLCLWREMAVDEIALSIAANGFFRHEPLYVAEESGKIVVIEGNRRVAAVRLLRDPSLRRKVGATDLPEISRADRDKLAKLPCIKCTRKRIWQFIGFKHVNGPQNWDSYSKAHYIAFVHNKFRVPLDEIARDIGDKHATVRRLYAGLMVLEQAEAARVFDREDRAKKHFSFSHLYTGLTYRGIQKFLGVSDRALGERKPVPQSHLAELGDLCVWLFGSKSEDREPVVQSQNPDLKKLDEVLQVKRATVALRQGLPLDVSLDIGRGDERVFREAIIGAKQALQKARGTVLTGYSGATDLMKAAKEIKELAEDVYGEMSERRSVGKPKTRNAR